MISLTKIPKRIDTRKSASSSRKVYIYDCIECGANEIQCEQKYLIKHSGKCIYCVHKGVPFQSSYKHMKDGVVRNNKRRRKQKTFDLTFEEFLEFTNISQCHYCNMPINWVRHTGSGQYRYNLDRKDSSIGYSKENCVVCCKRCNYMKGDQFSYEEFVNVVDLLQSLRGDFKYAR